MAKRFQLVGPIVGTKAYQTESFDMGVKKCYQELKQRGGSNFNKYDTFSVMDMDTYETYKFKIDKTNIPFMNPPTQIGGVEKTTCNIQGCNCEKHHQEIKAKLEEIERLIRNMHDEHKINDLNSKNVF